MLRKMTQSPSQVVSKKLKVVKKVIASRKFFGKLMMRRQSWTNERVTTDTIKPQKHVRMKSS